MAHIMVLDDIDEDIFVCGRCKSVFYSLQIFLDHKRSNCSSFTGEKSTNADGSASQPVTGSNCVSSNIAILSESDNPGINITNPTTADATTEQIWPKDLTCTLCKKKFKKIKSLLTHMKTHSEKPYQCPICGRCFLQNSHLQRHIPSHKMFPDGVLETTAKTLEVDLLSYTCPYCDLILPNYNQYRAHQKIHSSLKQYRCIQGECMAFYETVEGLMLHVTSNHVKAIYTCHICNATFNLLEEIAIHHQGHSHRGKEKATDIKLFKCSQCDARFRKSENLTVHMLTENHNKMCIHCNKTFASDKRLRLHLQIHRKLKPFQCTICNSSFHMKKYLSTHMLKHGNRQFQCPVCKFMFKRQDLLQRHMKNHQNKKMFKCPFKETLDCKKEFCRSDKLKLHIKCHTKNMAKLANSKVKVTQDETAELV